MRIQKNKNKGLRTSHATFYAAEIICGLEYLHKQGITHRDLKPENILLKEGHISIGDFGISKCKIEEWTENSWWGTKAYISPEMYKSKEYDNRVDWWSLGIIIYFMLKGETPFGTEDEDRIRAITWDSSHEFKFDSATFKDRNSSSIINSLLK